MRPCVVMRACNDMPIIKETLNALSRQKQEFRLIVFDNDSTDGTREIAEQYADLVVNVPRGEYVPGKILNQGMSISHSDIVVFLNSDCTPTSKGWLSELIGGFHSPEIAAVFGAQLPRKECHPVHAKDIHDTFGDGHSQAKWLHCFSMAASAIKRDVWNELMFSESLKYSEDIDWTWAIKQMGYKINYMPEAKVLHSHNYTIKQSYKRHYGEGEAEANIFKWSKWQMSFTRYAILPFIKRIVSDWNYAIREFDFYLFVSSPVIRAAQVFGRWQGFRQGLRKLYI
jgi:GT2 family glycosyltransferase